VGGGDRDVPTKRKNNLNTQQRQKLARRRIKTAINLYFLKRMALNYTLMFQAVMNATQVDMSKVLVTIESEDLIKESIYFLSIKNTYLKEH